MTSTGNAPYFVAIAPGFARHPKVVRLGKPERRWTWLQIMCWCGEYGTGGEVDPDIIREVVHGATPTFLARCVELGLLDRDPAGRLLVHDWDEFNGTSRERLLARERKRAQREVERLERDAGVTVERDSPVTVGHATRAADTSTSKPRSTQTAPQDGSTTGGRAAADTDIAPLLALLAVSAAQAEHVRGMALRSPAVEVERLVVEVGAGVLDPLGYVLRRLGEVAA